MFNKKLSVAAMLAALSVSALVSVPARAQETEGRDRVDAMYGHPLRMHLQEMDPEAVVVARVRSKAGDIASLGFIIPESIAIEDREYTTLNLAISNWDVVPGSDVVLAYKDGKWHYVTDVSGTTCTLGWISHLKLKTVPQVQSVSIDWGESKPVALPPVAPRTVAAPAPVAEPIRGMW